MKKFLLFAVVGFYSSMCFAQTQTLAPASPANVTPAPVTGSPASQQPIEITASKTVEWLRNQSQYVARENVIVTQGTMNLLTDLLTADYRESAQSKTEIYQLTAIGHVQIKDQDNTAYGDKAVYDVDKALATLTGKDLRLISPEQTVTASDRMEYYSNERKAKAIGHGKVVRGQDILTADILTAYFKNAPAPNASPPTPVQTTPVQAPTATSVAVKPNVMGGGSIDRLEADGNVTITTPTEVLTGEKGVYRAETNIAILTGKVKIVRGDNILEGDHAEVNLTTNVSKMFSSTKPGGRVRGVFFPGTDKKLIVGAPASPTATSITPSQTPAAIKAAPTVPLGRPNTPIIPPGGNAKVTR